MARKVITMAKLARREALTRFIRGVNCILLIVFCASAGFLVVATALPQKRELDSLKVKLEEAKQREDAVMAERDSYAVEHRALREDPEFLEIHARDRLDYYREGERVLKLRSGR